MKVSLVIVSKDEPALADTLDAVEKLTSGLLDEVVVVDASQQRLDRIRVDHPWVVWHDYEQPEGVRVTISHQRNIGVARARGRRDRLHRLRLHPTGALAQIDFSRRFPTKVSGSLAVLLRRRVRASTRDPAGGATPRSATSPRLRRSTSHSDVEAFDVVGGFDESFAAGEDIDFTWRLNDAGYRLRWVPNAVVEHEWGDTRRQMRRSFSYGAAWARLFRKHPRRLRAALQDHPVAVVYPLFLLGLPLTIRYRTYPLLLLDTALACPPRRGPLACPPRSPRPRRGRPGRGGRALPVSAPVRVLVTPKDENPYQRLLYDEVTAAGAEVRYAEGPSGSQTFNLLVAPLMLVRYRLSRLPGTAHPLGVPVLVAVGRRLGVCAPRHAVVVLVLPLVGRDSRLPHRVDRPRPVATRSGLLRRSSRRVDTSSTGRTPWSPCHTQAPRTWSISERRAYGSYHSAPTSSRTGPASGAQEARKRTGLRGR